MRAALFGLVLAGCFGPSLDNTPFRCGPQGECPPGYDCVLGWCGNGPPIDAGPIDTRRDIDGPTCAAGTFLRCKDADTAVYCDDDGNGEVEQSCAFQCNEPLKLCMQCDPSRPTSCDANTLVTCDTTGHPTTRNCMGWCEENSQAATCVVLAPANLPEEVCLGTTDQTLRVSADLFVDTTACTGGTIVTQPFPIPLFLPPIVSPPEICLYVYREVRVDAGGTVLVRGDRALAVVATKDMEIEGTVDVGADLAENGPGVSLDHLLGTGQDAWDFVIGGGGAGFATLGPPETEHSAAGGAIYGAQPLIPLWAGSPGGLGGVEGCLSCAAASPGGGGGGAVHIVSCGPLTLKQNGRVLAGGGGGGGGDVAFIFDGDAAGGGGGGSGGAVLIEAERIILDPFVRVTANGGGGGGGGRKRNAPGDLGAPGKPGSNGTPDDIPAAGGAATAGAGQGGTGGTRGDVSNRGELPSTGKAASHLGSGAGGAGGAAGRIRVNTRSGNPLPVPQGTILNPPPSVGNVGRHVDP